MVDSEQHGIKDYLLHAPLENMGHKETEVKPLVVGRHVGKWELISLKEYLSRRKQKTRLPCGSGT